jgi:hypothetical protein
VKKSLFINFVLIISAICIFVNSLGFNAYAENQIIEKEINKKVLNNSDEFKSIKSISLVDIEESMIEIENFDNEDDDDDDSKLLFLFSIKSFEIKFCLEFSNHIQKSHSKLLFSSKPLYLKYNNFRI